MLLQERRDLQRLLPAKVSVVAPDTLVIEEEFGDLEEPRRRIDLLGIDRGTNLVVTKVKWTEDNGHTVFARNCYGESLMVAAGMRDDKTMPVLCNSEHHQGIDLGQGVRGRRWLLHESGGMFATLQRSAEGAI